MSAHIIKRSNGLYTVIQGVARQKIWVLKKWGLSGGFFYDFLLRIWELRILDWWWKKQLYWNVFSDDITSDGYNLYMYKWALTVKN
jgi:hypothetical protein